MGTLKFAKAPVTLLKAFVGEEPEALVFAVVHLGDEYRPAHGSAVLVADQLRRGIGEVIAGARHAIAVVAVGLEERAVYLVRAALGGQDDVRRPRVLGGARVDLHGKLLDAVQAGRTVYGAAAVYLVGQGGAVQDDIVRPNAAAKSSQVAVGIERHARDRVHQGHDVPAVDRQLLDACSFERVSQGSRIRDDYGGHVLHFHYGLRSRGLKCDRHRGRPLRLHLQGGFELVHAGKFGRYFVWTGNHGGKHVDPRPVAHRFELDTGRRIGQYHGDIWNDRGRRVLDDPAHAAVTGLGPTEGGKKRHH